MLEEVLSSRLEPCFKKVLDKSRYLFAVAVIRYLTWFRFGVQSSCWVALEPALQHSLQKRGKPN